MRSVIAGLVLGALVVVQAVPASANTQGSEVGLALAAAGLNLLYVPAKAVTAVCGLALGGTVALLTGGDVRSAYALWVPAASGTFVITPAQLEGTKPLDFFGSDYSDRPSTHSLQADGSLIYDAAYSM